MPESSPKNSNGRPPPGVYTAKCIELTKDGVPRKWEIVTGEYKGFQFESNILMKYSHNNHRNLDDD